LSDKTLLAECTISQWTVDNSNTFKRTHYSQIPPPQYCKQSEQHPQSIMKGKYTNGKIKPFGTRSVHWQEKQGLWWRVQNLQMQGNLDKFSTPLRIMAQPTRERMAHTTRMDIERAFRSQNDQGNKITGCNITSELQEHKFAYQSEEGPIVGILVVYSTSCSSSMPTKLTNS
jgi:hypothetical protein